MAKFLVHWFNNGLYRVTLTLIYVVWHRKLGLTSDPVNLFQFLTTFSQHLPAVAEKAVVHTCILW